MDGNKKLLLTKIALILISCVAFIIILFKYIAFVNASILLKFLGFAPIIMLAILSIIEMLPKARK